MITVVVPIYNVEDYLRACLQSIAGQTLADFEVVMVDDGSTDGSAAIAREFVAVDQRFRLISQANGGLANARNTGIAEASGDFLAFVDSDDLLPPNAYQLLLGTLQQTGSDFATGNVHRLTGGGHYQAPFLRKAFALDRRRTHITRFHALLADRPAWNKLWRRSFWGDRRFPEGILYEDAPLVIPAHFEAEAVDVIAEPVYLYRIRPVADQSITQRHFDPTLLRDRLAGIARVRQWLRAHGPVDAERWYLEQVLRDELALHLVRLDQADDAYAAFFLDELNAFLDDVDPTLLDLRWQLVRERRIADLRRTARAARRPSITRRIARHVPLRYRTQVREAVRRVRSAG